MRIIPIKNYLLAFLLTILTFVVVLFLVNYYTESKKYSTNNRMSILYHLDEKSIENYLLENHNTIIYISNSIFSLYLSAYNFILILWVNAVQKKREEVSFLDLG